MTWWQDPNLSGYTDSIFVQSFAANGTPTGGARIVTPPYGPRRSSYVFDYRQYPVTVPLGDGRSQLFRHRHRPR